MTAYSCEAVGRCPRGGCRVPVPVIRPTRRVLHRLPRTHARTLITLNTRTRPFITLIRRAARGSIPRPRGSIPVALTARVRGGFRDLPSRLGQFRGVEGIIRRHPYGLRGVDALCVGVL